MVAKISVLPVPAGNIEALRKAFEEMEGPRREQCIANRQVMGTAREFVCLQHMPQGDVIVIYEEIDDPTKTMERMIASDSEYAHWIVNHVMPLLGADGLQSLPPSEVLADWRA